MKEYVEINLLKTELAKISLENNHESDTSNGYREAMRAVSRMVNELPKVELYTKQDLDDAYEKGNSYGAERVRSYSPWMRR